jgi:HAD superfamily hydrolase (TIGR01484 family)
MRKLSECDVRVFANVEAILSDIDDTLTLNGKLPAVAYAALEALRDDGIKTVAITGRPAGWCDLIARQWPVDGVVGENGAFYFRYDQGARRMIRRFLRSDEERRRDRAKLMEWFEAVQKTHPAIRLAADQDFRISDIAIDVREDVQPLSDDEVTAVMAELAVFGATVKLSSIHINAWIGAFDKLSMSKLYLADELGIPETALRERVLYIGDSPNDEPMFRELTLTVAVKNIEDYIFRLKHMPAFITEAPGGLGFAEMVRVLRQRGREAKK